MSPSNPTDIPTQKDADAPHNSDDIAYQTDGAHTSLLSSSPTDNDPLLTPNLGPNTPGTPRLSRNPSFSGSSSYQDDWEVFPPLDRISMLDILDHLALPQQLEKIQKGISAQTQGVRKSRDVFKEKSRNARERMVEEWRRRAPTSEEQLERYRKRMRHGVDRLGRRWNDTKIITLREKVSFICGVMNIFISGYLLAGYPEWFHVWYTAQLFYFMPLRIYTYHSRGYHYFLADLCYFVNFLLMLSIWMFPGSKRLFTATYCLAFGNNAVAVIMWRNSLVFHSFDKVTTLFIHIMPCATLHSMVHLWSNDNLKDRFPAIWTIQNSPVGSATAYGNVISMLAWSSLPYILWQLSYYFFITIRRREKIAAGRPTSFTWLRRSYSKTWIGQFVLSLPGPLQEPAFMGIQSCYAILTMLPCPLWFTYKYLSAAFLITIFVWSIYNGSTYYIDVFGKRFQRELDALKAEVTKWQNSPDLPINSPLVTPNPDGPVSAEFPVGGVTKTTPELKANNAGLDQIPLLNGMSPGAISTGLDGGAKDVARERKMAEFGS